MALRRPKAAGPTARGAAGSRQREDERPQQDLGLGVGSRAHCPCVLLRAAGCGRAGRANRDLRPQLGPGITATTSGGSYIKRTSSMSVLLGDSSGQDTAGLRPVTRTNRTSGVPRTRRRLRGLRSARWCLLLRRLPRPGLHRRIGPPTRRDPRQTPGELVGRPWLNDPAIRPIAKGQPKHEGGPAPQTQGQDLRS
jgi:hypothetical protein